jgi:cytochrome c oxidase cbb3-type subunit III
MKETAVVLVIVMLLAGCKREERSLRLPPPLAAAFNQVALMPNKIGGAPPYAIAALDHPYDKNAYQLAQGKRLWAWFGCPACHGDGSGKWGPSLVDGWWRYGPDEASIFVTIRDGRPGGMPSFADKMTTEQIWQLTGYVRAMGADYSTAAAPGRNDDVQTRPAENRAPVAPEQLRHPAAEQ